MRPAARTWLVVVALTCVACGSNDRTRDATPGDAAADGGAADATTALRVEPPAPPTAAEPTSFAPCPMGWNVVETEGGAEACEAWPGGVPPDCDDAEMALPGEGCAPIGPACPADGWPAGLPAENVVFVRAGAVAGGDGTREQPFDRIASGVSAARRGDVVAIATGAYDESVSLRDGVTLWGACVAETLVRGRPRFADVTIAAEGLDVVVRGLHVQSADRGIGVHVGAALRLEDALVEGDVIPIQVEPMGALETSNVYVRGGDVSGIDADGGSRLALSRTVIAGSRGTGLNVVALESVDPIDLVLADIALLDHAAGGVAVRELPGSTVAIARVAAAECSLGGVFVEGATGTIDDVSVRSTRRPASDDPTVGFGLFLQTSDVTVRHLFVDDVDDYVLLAFESTADVDGVIARGSRTELPEIVAIQVEGSTATLRHVHVEDAASAAALGVTQSQVTIEDLVATGVAPAEGLLGGVGLLLLEGAVVTAERVHVTHATNVAINVARGAELDASDVVIEDTRPSFSGIGYGFQIIGGSRLGLARADVSGSVATALYVSSSRVRMADVSLRDTAGIDVRDRRGAGLIALVESGPAVVEAQRLRVRGSVRDGIIVFGEGASLTASDVDVGDVAAAACDDGACAGSSGGSGITCGRDARIDIDGVLVENAAFAGLLWADRCVPRARRGVVRTNAFGLLNDDTVDLDGVLDGVSFVDNEVDFQTTALSIEAPAAPLDL